MSEKNIKKELDVIINKFIKVSKSITSENQLPTFNNYYKLVRERINEKLLIVNKSNEILYKQYMDKLELYKLYPLLYINRLN